ncbi:hypothetical protein PIB30_073228 [Stylosanthes scabra]|uniref:Uncharacterized protein n=1 Tax=Stylosanthes scabra TaxID=79078 RepID=A0ABU6ZMZ0_9FABA|nr:hypothetical protein [Stylosanthes scabra]
MSPGYSITRLASDPNQLYWYSTRCPTYTQTLTLPRHAPTGNRPPPRRRPFFLLLPLTSSAPKVSHSPTTPPCLASPRIIRFVTVASPRSRTAAQLALSSSCVHRLGSPSHEVDLEIAFCRSHSRQPASRWSFLGFSQPTSASCLLVLAAHVASPSFLVNSGAELSPIDAVYHQLQIPLKCDMSFCQGLALLQVIKW